MPFPPAGWLSRFSWTGSVAGVGVGLLMSLMAGGVRASTLIANISQTHRVLTGEFHEVAESLSLNIPLDRPWLLQDDIPNLQLQFL